MPLPYMHWDEYRDEITRKFGMKHLIEQITQYLHDVGKVRVCMPSAIRLYSHCVCIHCHIPCEWNITMILL